MTDTEATDGDKEDTSAAKASLRRNVQRWDEHAWSMPADKVNSTLERLYKFARERGPWSVDDNDDLVKVSRADLLVLLRRGIVPGDRESCILIPDHHHLTTTSACEGDPETALLDHIAAALNNDMGPEVTAEGRARILRYLLDRETDQMKETEIP